jgi:hypothetical protein
MNKSEETKMRFACYVDLPVRISQYTTVLKQLPGLLPNVRTEVSMKYESGKSFEFSDVPRPRLNLLDVMTVVMPPGIPVPMWFDIDRAPQKILGAWT